MKSIDLIRSNLDRSAEIVLGRIDDMRDHAMVVPTPHGGCHTLWTLGHLAYIEGLVTREFMLGEANPLGGWKEAFDGDEVSGNPADFPPFSEALAAARAARARTIHLIDSLTEHDLDRPSLACPEGFTEMFGTYRRCLQFVADHWYMHRGQLADARRAAGIDRMWL